MLLRSMTKGMPLILTVLICLVIFQQPLHMGYTSHSSCIRISRICDTFQSFVIRHTLLTEKLIKQGFGSYSKLCKFFKKFVRRYYIV